jgi:hypothetical protein
MLLVSAIVLSTSTYAWFSAGATVSVGDITATIEQTDGSIEISADNTNWGSSIGLTELKAVAGNALFYEGTATATKVANLTPVSATPGTGSMTFVNASLAGNADGTNTVTSTTTAAVADGKYVYYSFYIKAGNADTEVTITPNFTVSGDKNFVLGAVSVDGGAAAVYGSSSSVTYLPMTAGKTAVDSDANCIIDSSDASAGVPSGTLGTQVTSNGTAFTDVKPGTSGIQVKVWIWAEGQQADCAGSVSGLSGTFAFTIATES